MDHPGMAFTRSSTAVICPPPLHPSTPSLSPRQPRPRHRSPSKHSRAASYRLPYDALQMKFCKLREMRQTEKRERKSERRREEQTDESKAAKEERLNLLLSTTLAKKGKKMQHKHDSKMHSTFFLIKSDLKQKYKKSWHECLGARLVSFPRCQNTYLCSSI